RCPPPRAACPGRWRPAVRLASARDGTHGGASRRLCPGWCSWFAHAWSCSSRTRALHVQRAIVMSIEVQRAYEASGAHRGRRLLVDRYWARGVKKGQLELDGWLRDIAPSDGLRKWFGHDPDRWDEFVDRYGRELDRRRDLWEPLLASAKRGRVVLLFGAR